MAINVTAGTHRTNSRLVASYRVTAETESRLELHARRITAFIAAAFLGVFGGIFAGAAWRFYRPPDLRPEVLAVGGLGVALLLLAGLMLYFGLRRPDRILVDGKRREVLFERRRRPLALPFDRIVDVRVDTEDRSRNRTRLIVHPVVLVTHDGDTLEVDAASDIEKMIRLAARLRRVLDIPLEGAGSDQEERKR